MRPKKRSITRNDFISRFHRCGLTYRKATEIFDTMVDVVGTAVLNGQQVEFGRVGKITPSLFKAKTVSMNFHGRRRQIILGQRLRYKFRIHKAFINSHPIDWF